jgi:hypothetical protein
MRFNAAKFKAVEAFAMKKLQAVSMVYDIEISDEGFCERVYADGLVPD